MAQAHALRIGHGAQTRENNKVRAEDYSVHGWYRFILSYPPHLVRDYTERFGIRRGKVILDPFCGTGTTLVECKKIRNRKRRNRIAGVPKRELMRRGINQHTLEKICREEPVRTNKLVGCLKVLEQ